MKQDKFDGFLICSGKSKKQINQFKRLFARDNLSNLSKSSYYLQMRKVAGKDNFYLLDVYINKRQKGHFAVFIMNTKLIPLDNYQGINESAEKMFREESLYGIKDREGLDRINHSLISGWGDYEHYSTVTSKAANLWYKLARNQFFHNGNKRTALISSILFLRSNLYCFNASDGNEMYDLSMKAAQDKIGANKIEQYIIKHVTLDYSGMASVLKHEPIEINQKIDYNMNP